jgi:hypothetical protein
LQNSSLHRFQDHSVGFGDVCGRLRDRSPGSEDVCGRLRCHSFGFADVCGRSRGRSVGCADVCGRLRRPEPEPKKTSPGGKTSFPLFLFIRV